MDISVIGSGYVGLVAGVCLADLGNNVICVDNDEEKIRILNNGDIPIYEPGLKDIMDINVREGRLKFTTDLKSSVENSTIIFIAVGTPPDKDHKADLSYVKQVSAEIGGYINGYKIIVNKSTVPVGTGQIVKNIIKENLKGNYDFDVVSNPEFLREGSAVKDFVSPDRVVVGCESEKAEEFMLRIYRNMARVGNPIFVTDIETAEMIKYASNALLATKISFINEIARLCEKVGANVKEVAKGVGLDNRIGPKFLQAGVGYGGSCFPKDVKALVQIGKENDIEFKIIRATENVNMEQRYVFVEKVKSIYPDVNGKKFAVWGLAFKPRTDDMREAPSITIINKLLGEGAEIIAYDPVAKDNALKIMPDIKIADSPYDALKGCDALLVLTEWNEFRALNMDKVKSLLKSPVIIDGRNIYEPAEMKKTGFNYISFGR